MNRIL